MTTPEELLASIEASKAQAEQLKTQIVRAQSWDQLFPSPEVAQAEFQRLVNEHRSYYKENDPSVKYTVEPHPAGDIHRVVRHKGHEATYQRLANGDIILIFYSPDNPPHENLITPSIGNINHTFTAADIVIPDQEAVLEIELDKDRRNKVSSKIGSEVGSLPFYLKGKPATQGWEDTMLYNGFIPQRIGYKLFPNKYLEALTRLKEVCPELFLTTPHTKP